MGDERRGDAGQFRQWGGARAVRSKFLRIAGLTFAGLVGCGGDETVPGIVAAAGSGGDAPTPNAPAVDIGLSSGVGGLDFERLEPGASVALHTFGQGGTHALLAIRCIGFGNRAFVNVDVTNLNSGV
jgi:hypothetical protein